MPEPRVNGDISSVAFSIIFNQESKKFVLCGNGYPIPTPAGKVVEHETERFLQRVSAELDGEEKLDPAMLGRYSIYSTYRDHFASNGQRFSVDELFELLIGDRLLHLAAGPEAVSQSRYLGPFERMLADRGWGQFNLPDSLCHADRDAIAGALGAEVAGALDAFANGLRAELNSLHPAQLAVVVNVAVVYGSVCLGYLLATRQCTELEFAMAILATDCCMPKIFADVSRESYRGHLRELIYDAHSLVDFAREYVAPSSAVRTRLKERLPGFAFLPEASQWALVESMNQIESSDGSDFSGYVVLLGKALEVALFEKVFEEFRCRNGMELATTIKANLTFILKDCKSAEKFATYVSKPPHRMELGSMMFTLELYGGSTAQRFPALGRFHQFVKAEYPLLVERQFSIRGKEVADCRNRAAHRETFSLQEAVSVRDEVLDLLRMM